MGKGKTFFSAKYIMALTLKSYFKIIIMYVISKDVDIY